MGENKGKVNINIFYKLIDVIKKSDFCREKHKGRYKYLYILNVYLITYLFYSIKMIKFVENNGQIIKS
jgi:hypothetical protein